MADYPCRKLQTNASKSIPRHIIAVNVETCRDQSEDGNGVYHRTIKCGVAIKAEIKRDKIIGITVKHFTDPKEFWRFTYATTRHKRTTWTVAYQALLDLKALGIQGEFENGSLSIDRPRQRRTDKGRNSGNQKRYGLCVLENPPTIIGVKCRATGGRIAVVDSSNWFKATIQGLSEAVSCPRLDEPKATDPLSAWAKHCERDCEIVFRNFIGLIGYCAENDMGMFVYTAAGQAMQSYRHRGMMQPIYFHTEAECKQLERASYYGGRTSVFRRGPIREDVWQYDVNGLYPFVMANYLYPCKLLHFEARNEYGDIPQFDDTETCIAQCKVRTTRAIIPVKVEKHTEFPTGSFETVLAGAELSAAISAGSIVAVKAWSKYKCCDLFSKWVSDLHQLRLRYTASGNPLYASLTKLIMNSLYGKFGQQSPKWVELPDRLDGTNWSQWVELDPLTDRPTSYCCVDNMVYIQREKREIERTFVAISAFVAAQARCHMNRLRNYLGESNVYYQGVDSLIVNRAAHERIVECELIHPTELGRLKLECFGNFGDIYGQMDYHIGDKIVIAGRPQNGEELEYGRLLYSKFAGRSALFDRRPGNIVTETLAEWKANNHYSPGKLSEPEWIQPPRLDASAASISSA